MKPIDNKQPIQKSDSKGKAIASFVLGIISALPFTALLLAILLALIAPGFMYYGATRGQSILILYAIMGVGYFYPVSFLTGIAGVFFGKQGLKSIKKNLAVIGIILSIIGIGGSIYIFILQLLT